MARYAEAVEWIAMNDDTSEITNPFEEPAVLAAFAPVTVVMAADLFNKDIEEVIVDVQKFLKKNR